MQAVSEILVSQGHKVTVLTFSHQANLPTEELYNGVQVIRAPYIESRGKLNTWSFMYKNWSVLRAAEILHVHDIMWAVAPFGPLLYRKVHLTHHGWEGVFPVPAKNKLQRWLWAKMARTLTHVGAWIQEFYWEKPDFITYGGVHIAQTEVTKPGRKNTIAFFGRLEKENDIELYLELVKSIQQANKKVEITWIGDGKYREQCARLGKVTGMVSNPEKYLQQATVVFASSYLSMLQAQTMGKVVCAMWSTQLKRRYLETFPGRTYLILGADPQQLVPEILRCLSNPDTEASTTIARWACTQSWDRVAAAYQKLWDK